MTHSVWKPTDQQQKAIETKHVSVVLSAGAGCGKTSVLTQRYLSHLEPPHLPEVSRLVAITFTERAAREMRERIQAQCAARLTTCDEQEVPHWLAVGRSLESARINTIHGFCASLLRSHAVEAELDPKFGLLDEMLGASFLGNSIESGLHKLLADGDADAAELVFEFGLNGARNLLSHLVQQRFRIVEAQWAGVTAEDLSARWDDRWRMHAVPSLFREFANSAVVRRTRELLQKPIPGNAVMQERRHVLLEQFSRIDAGESDLAILDSIRENARVQGGGAKKNQGNEDAFADVKEALTELRGLVDKVRDQLDYDPKHLVRGAEIGLHALCAAIKVGDHYDAEKRDAAVLDFDDLLLRARNLLHDHEEVRRRAEAGISLLMVDEFQDTDPIQDKIVQMLCGNALLDGRLFVVGDAKQSIYRFRRAEPKVFHELRARVREAGRLPLNRNYRSQPQILAFVNCVFDGALGSEYEPLEASSPQVTESPCIEFLFSSAGADDAEADGDDDNAAARRRREADWIARRLKQLLRPDGDPCVREEDKTTGDFRLRQVKCRDIAILFRAMSDVRYYEEALRAQGLDCYVVGGRAFFAQQEIYDVVNLCQFLNNVDDEVSLVGVLRSPFFSLSDDAIAALGPSPARALDGAPPAWLSDEQQALVSYAGEVLRELRDRKDRLSIAQLLNLAVERTGYDAALLSEFLGARKLANLRKLIDMARQFDQSGLFTLSDFVARLRDAVAEETHEPLAATHPETANVIRLMSIHQSKGLEYPVVVVADMDRQVRGPAASAHFDAELGPVVALPKKFGEERKHPAQQMLRMAERQEDLVESRRLLYVAMTRAKDMLILSANLKHAGRASQPWLTLVGERFDLLTGEARHAPTADGVSIIVKYSKALPAVYVHEKPTELDESKGIRESPGQSPPLSKFREMLEKSIPTGLPELAQEIKPDAAARRRFSVSELEDIDSRLRSESRPPDRGETPADRRHGQSDPESDGASPMYLSAAEQLGTLVHQVLERVDFQNPQPAAILDRCCHSAGRAIDESIRKTAGECVQNLLVSPLGTELARARAIHREIDFLLRFVPVGSAGTGQQVSPGIESPYIISGTIDCLFESARGEWFVLDYKTGLRDRSTSPAALLEDYEIQLGLYSIAIRQFFGRAPESIELVFVRNGIERVAFEPTEKRLAEITMRVSQALQFSTSVRQSQVD